MTNHPKSLQEETKPKMHKTVNRIHSSLKPAFTIVELLIVVIVIAILATITMVAYDGITNNAKESSLKADLNTTAKKVGLVNAETGSYPSTKPSDLPSYIQYSQTNSGQGFCATASKDGKAYHITESGTIQTGPCSGHTVAGGGGTEIAASSPIQNVTSAQCQALPVYTGSNPTAIRTVTDTRGGTTRTYEIAKLADNKCWMLTNLKLGSTTSSITLTPSDSNVASNFTLPRLSSADIPDYDPGEGGEHEDYNDNPHAWGPVPGDTGSGATNYGYLYNWSAATAGATRTSNAAGSGNAVNSICPANWRLPSGYTNQEGTEIHGDFPDLYRAFGGTGTDSANGEADIAQWQPSGPFKGVFSGGWGGSFLGQGSYAGLWSSTAHASSANSAHNVNFSSGNVFPAINSSNGRFIGFGVRCLLN